MSDLENEPETMVTDIVCVGFGPATAGFLTTLSKEAPALESRVMPGMPLQVMCYERADGVGFGVSGVVTRARGIRATLPDLDASQIPMATSVQSEKLIYLLDPIGASRRSATLRFGDRLLRFAKRTQFSSFELPYIPGFLAKHGGLLMSLGQFLQWSSEQVMASGAVQIWPGVPVEEAIIEDKFVRGVRLADQGVGKNGEPESGFLPGMNVRAALTVIGDGPVGAVGRQLDQVFGAPNGRDHREWALGMKMVIDLPDHADLEPGTVIHTFGYPEPEIFGFFYVHPNRVATAGIFVPSWFRSQVRTAYRYLQHFLLHPYLWRWLEGGRLRSWGAKSIDESGRRGEPFLAGDGYARIGEGSGSTNVLTGSGVDEAWTTGSQLAEAVVELLKQGKPFTWQNLESSYVARRRLSWIEREGRIAERARDGFHRGLLPGLLGMAISSWTGGRVAIGGRPRAFPDLAEIYRDKIPAGEVERIVAGCRANDAPCHNALMERCGWPAIPYDGQLLVSHQDALLRGGKVQAPPGYADHVKFKRPEICTDCATKLCVEMCSGEAITLGRDAIPVFDREKCVHCGACLWNCTARVNGGGNIVFQAGAGGLHSSEN